MLEYLEVYPCNKPLSGTVKVSGAKNSVLPCLVATLLTAQTCTLRNVPAISDIFILVQLLERFGAVSNLKEDTAEIKVPNVISTEASYALVKALRASFWVLAPLLARAGAAKVALPGGDAIGARPVDIHLEALVQMGAEVQIKSGSVIATAPNGLHGAELNFRFPSVGATHQILMAAALTPDTTIIHGAAREPEVVQLCSMLSQMGAKIHGAGTSDITVVGQKTLGGCDISIIGDRIEAGTFLLSGAITHGKVKVEGATKDLFGDAISVFTDMGATLKFGDNFIELDATSGNLSPINISTAPFPGFPSDLQPQLMAALTKIPGTSSITETIYEGRFRHASELSRMGAHIKIEDRTAFIEGGYPLSGAPVDGLDIRAAVALVMAGLTAQGNTEIYEIHHLRRGYEKFEQKMKQLGAKLLPRLSEHEEQIFIGC